MSDIFHIDEEVSLPTNSKILETLKKDIFLNGKLISEGTPYSVSPPKEDEE